MVRLKVWILSEVGDDVVGGRRPELEALDAGEHKSREVHNVIGGPTSSGNYSSGQGAFVRLAVLNAQCLPIHALHGKGDQKGIMTGTASDLLLRRLVQK